ncbi:acetylxylan esterase [Streptococcus suis]|nr:acetylxylan esterase [Streptococcus suis]MDG4518893.1 acetylxylan esterase [Streptococcus suis]
MEQYYGRQEKPDDIDKFWSDAIASVEHPISYELFERDCTTDAIKTFVAIYCTLPIKSYLLI